MSEFHNLKISKLAKETEDCVTIYFDVPDDLKDTFIHNAGQYLTIKTEINGEDVRRAYSICTCTTDRRTGVSVKQVKNGLMSTYLNQQIKIGDELEVMTPDGKFVLNTDPLLERDHYFIAAGSGITPIMSMIQSVLEEEPKSSCHLLYGNRHEDSIIFKNKLETMVSSHVGQLTVLHTLSNPKRQKKGGLLSAFSKGKISWKGEIGRINTNILTKWMSDNPGKSIDKQFYLCGPSGMIGLVKSYFENEDIDEENIHVEYFASGDEKKSINATDGATVIATLEGGKHTVNVPQNKSILDALLEEKIDAPYSCTSGACSTCMAKVLRGSAEMETCFALDDGEVADGYILTCQAHPTSDIVEVTFDF